MQTVFQRLGRAAWACVRGGLLCGALGLSAAASQAYTLSVLPALQSVHLGQQVVLTIQAADVLPGGLGSYDFDLGFDAGILAFNHADDSMGLGFAIGLDKMLGAGFVTFIDTSLEDPLDLVNLQAAGDVTLFTVYFDTLAVGSSALTLANVTLNDASAAVVAHTDFNGRVTVLDAELPEPGTLALVGAAACAGLGLRRRQRLQPA